MTSDASLPETAELPPKDCWQLLRGDSVGRLAVWVNDHPEIFPINYKVDHESLVFRTGAGTKLASSLGKQVALEADGADTDKGVAWSVIVKGQATALSRTPEVMDTIGQLLFPWETGRKDHFIRIVPESVSGRRFKIAAPLTWGGSLDEATRAGLE
ncbi:pyridoxamine 5'-phosphate oxidase family protein [Arthrobacter sp. HMWF013]|uniref:pyridoxamine 5'-phosphate oxidase family protein n=1 Tax=Arthrobacter sp. HMWF013 TaxID=2056849 RepID=UPI000D38CEE3|nr:pyridoxamine 5'-phosphate oxidase family protein [Arthrobacter sp. HMWF013]PTT60560.1 flavin-nucleotide-binding protein [Arthrobacter sp. HMWF013]